jgi:hypothetical protein
MPMPEQRHYIVLIAWAEAVELGRWPSQVWPYTRNRQHVLYQICWRLVCTVHLTNEHARRERAIFDLIIQHARIYDGTGNPSFVETLGVTDRRIIYPGRETGLAAQRTGARVPRRVPGTWCADPVQGGDDRGEGHTPLGGCPPIPLREDRP